MRTRLIVTLAALCVAVLAWGHDASAAKRIALVIGNDDYENLNKLGKAVNDSQAVAEALQDVGFSVISAENATRRDMNRRLSELDGSVLPGDTVFFFFAGHGVAIGSENYLLPVDIPKPREGEDGLIRDEAHSVDSIIARIQNRGAAVSMIVLDACRDNPFAVSGTRNLGAKRGLARIDTPDGVFVLYSAGIGQTALDSLGAADPNRNSVFTRKLVPLLRTAGMTHVALAKTVQQQVDQLASTVHHSQQPAYYDQIIGEIVLKPQDTAATAPAQPLSEAAEAWVTVNNSSSIAVLEAYIKRYQGTVFADLAQARLDEVNKAQVALLDRTVVVEPKTGDGAQTGSATSSASETPTPSDAGVAAESGPATEDAAAAASPTTVVASANPATEESLETVTDEGAGEPKVTDPDLLARQLQTELARVGCYRGGVDGDWGRGSAAALERFNEASGRELDAGEPSGEALDAVTAEQGTVCEAAAPAPAVKRKTKKVEPEPKPAKRVKAKAEPQPVKKKEAKPTVKAAPPKQTKAVSAKQPEQPKKKTFMKKPGVFDCSIYGTNTALQDLHRRQGHCE